MFENSEPISMLMCDACGNARLEGIHHTLQRVIGVSLRGVPKHRAPELMVKY